MKTALLIVDATPTFMPGGELPVGAGDQVVTPIRRLIREGNFDAVVDLREEHPAGHISFASTHGRAPLTTIELRGRTYMLWPDHALAGTANARLHPELAAEAITFTQLKGLRADEECYGGFAYADGVPTGLRAELKKRGIEKVVVVGLATDYCVAETALQAVENGFETQVVLEACRGVAPGTTTQALDRMNQKGIALTTTVAVFLSGLAPKAQVPRAATPPDLTC